MIAKSLLTTGLLLSIASSLSLNIIHQDQPLKQHAAADSIHSAQTDVPPGVILVRTRIDQLRMEQQTRATHLPVAGLHPRSTVVIFQPEAVSASPVAPARAPETIAWTDEPAAVVPEPRSENPDQALRIRELERQLMMLELLDSADANGLAEIATPSVDFSHLNLQIPFEVNSASLPEEVLPALEGVGEWLLRHPQLRLEITGHTDISGARALNVSLSEARASAVRSFLLTSFPDLDPTRLTSRGLGPDQPVADNATPEGRAQNRRVTFTLVDE